jgi:hypothetical protein
MEPIKYISPSSRRKVIVKLLVIFHSPSLMGDGKDRMGKRISSSSSTFSQ